MLLVGDFELFGCVIAPGYPQQFSDAEAVFGAVV